ncbi:branched-chain amino acid ABC transporter permease [Mesorhizobium sp. BAC0120]|uniref:branched-chain amino acid ABC transporter permease n=1 Tax=Mesorhizobium sp. BAC0120 TaxID=3090670 RepID=UPI00298D40F7|nr:branched-chain amino acid ABC transporter permease [Mesorhizobium sp. BAC0120]MDW6024979.1 branched-chain amino acid ABC transporter permease [Mesorhizobium sp. BAC0120]
MLYFFQQVLNGFHSSALYALLAFGYALTNGVLHRTNIAYGSVFAFAGQIMILAAVFGYQVLWLTLPATVAFGIIVAFLYAWLLSHVMARNVLGPLAESSPNAIVVVTLGVSMVLMELARISADTKDFWLPPMLATPVVFASTGNFQATLTVIQLIDCALVVLTILLASLVLDRTTAGRVWRAVCDDPHASAMCGINVTRVFRWSVLAGGLAAALAGVMAAFYFGNISFSTGLIFGLKILFITAVGGYETPSRAAAGAAAFGMAEALYSGYFPLEWRDVAMFALLVALLVLRPSDGVETKTVQP